ncbi:hypothetical protein ACFQ10_25650 [Streptomyces indonesiensis]
MRQTGGQGEHPCEQLTAAGAQVHQRHLGGVPQRLVHPAQQLRDRPREQR